MQMSYILIVIFAPLLVGQTPPMRAKFEDYPVKQIYSNTPAIPKLSKDQWSFRTRIRLGAKSPVEFAGHYTIPRFGCGTSCSGFFIVDSVSGKVFNGFDVSDLPTQWVQTQVDPEALRWEFHPNSRLFKIAGCINERDCGYYAYLMVDGQGLRLVSKQLLPENYQP